MITHKADGGRKVELFLPYDFQDKKIEDVTFGPLTLDHVLRWQKGQFKDVMDLMAELAGMNIECLRRLRYPDADRVLAVFFEMLPPEMRNDVGQSRVPQPPPEEQPAPDEQPAAAAGFEDAFGQP